MNYRHILEKGSKKHICPSCKKNRFVRFIDLETGNYLPEQYGRCDREEKCGYFLNPYSDAYSNNSEKISNGFNSQIDSYHTPIIKTPIFIPNEVLKSTLSNYNENVFIQNLLSRVKYPFQTMDVEGVVSLYNLGTIREGYRKGCVTFPFIDINGNVRAIQIKKFDLNNHTTGTDFIHSMTEKDCIRNFKQVPKWISDYKKNELKVSCLFGEHLLLKFPNNPIALVEAPKTAVYGTLYFGLPKSSNDFIWLAVYNLSSLKYDKCKILQGRKVVLFPDLSKNGSTYQKWSDNATEFNKTIPETQFQVSDLLEKRASNFDRESGKDLADYLIELDWRKFR